MLCINGLPPGPWGLIFHVGKRTMLHLARQIEKPCWFYTLGGEVIKSASEATFRGVILSNKYGTRTSNWQPHIDTVVAKASQRLGFLKRSLRDSPYKLRELAFEALVRSTLDYSGAIWDSTVDKEILKVERVQNRGARWVRGARGIISITALLKDIGWVSVATRRRNQRLCLFYKLLNQAIDVNVSELGLEQLKDSGARTVRGRHPNQLTRRSASNRHSPLWSGTVLRTIQDWNRLPVAALTAGSITTFQSQLKLHP